MSCSVKQNETATVLAALMAAQRPAVMWRDALGGSCVPDLQQP